MAKNKKKIDYAKRQRNFEKKKIKQKETDIKKQAMRIAFRCIEKLRELSNDL